MEPSSQSRQMFQMVKSGFELIAKAISAVRFPDKQKIEIAGAEVLTIKGQKGDSGDDGKTPTDPQLIELIKPLIPNLRQPEDGHTPTDEELLILIRPLIPAVKDGETPSDTRLLSLIRPLIPEINKEAIVKDASSVVIKEVIKLFPDKDTADEIIDKIQSVKKAWIPIDAIDGDFNTRVSRPANNFYNKRIDDLIDVDLSGLTVTNGKYVLGSGSGGGVSSIVAGTNITISPTNGLGAVTINSTGGGSGYQVATGTVNGSNTSFTFASAPNVIVADFVIMRNTETVSGTTNWSGTTSVTMAVAPTDHIYAIG